MSQNFKLKFDEMRQGNPAENSEDKADYQTYSTESHVRNICFEWPNGKMKFLNYAYLVSGEYDPDTSQITLMFTNDIVVVSGNNLGGLFKDLIFHQSRIIAYNVERYDLLKNPGSCSITDITITIIK